MRVATVLLSLGLAACSGGGGGDYNDAARISEKDAKAARAIEHAVQTRGAATIARGVPVETPTPGVDRSRALPTAFQGFWGVGPRDCELANINAHGRLFIDRDTLRFYESKATVAELQESSPTSAVAVLAFKGEGQRWTRRTTITLAAGGTRLTRTPDGERAITYQHC